MARSEKFRISVTELAKFSCRRGDLSTESVAGPSALEGMNAHKKFQSELIDNMPVTGTLQAEVSLKCTCRIEGREITLGGRIDLVDPQIARLCEIKSTYVAADILPESQIDLQWAQLYLYGFVFLECERKQQKDHKSLALELIHINLRNNDHSTDYRLMTATDLMTFAQTALCKYVQWIDKVEHHSDSMIGTATNLGFPFRSFRAGQRDMAAAVYRASRDGSTVLCEAPTGIGKTISTLYPAFKSMAEGHVSQIAYLTAKVAGSLSAQMALNKLKDHGLKYTVIHLKSKKRACFCTNGRCERDEQGRCPMTLGFFDRLSDARDELLQVGVISDEILEEIAWHHQLCPFELSQQMLPWVQVIIADYNYVFDPLVRLPYFSTPAKKTLVLIDEAHNLLDRSRSMFSAEISRIQCLQESEAYRATHPALALSLVSLSDRMLRSVRAMDTESAVTNVLEKAIRKEVSSTLQTLMEAMSKLPLLPESSSELFKALCRFSVISDIAADNHRCIFRTSRAGVIKEVTITLFCVDASADLSRLYKQYRSLVLFSGTLRPASFFCDTLGLPSSCQSILLTSPFQNSNAYRAVINWIDTRYRQRQASLDLLVGLIHEATSQKSGNYMVFFPSHAYLQQVYIAFTSRYQDTDTWLQERGQSRDEQSLLLSKLDDEGHRIGFAIQGGVFGEGIDYVGPRLIGVLVVGTGLPALDEQTKLVAEHYEKKGRSGFDFAYRYPGFTRVLQTAGRLIRHEQDRGFVLLIDDRFANTGYKQLYPQDWSISYPRDQQSLADDLRAFWSVE